MSSYLDYSTAGQTPNNPLPISSTRNPTTSDKLAPDGSPYNVGRVWVNTTTSGVWSYAGAGVWSLLGSGTTAAINSITGDSGGAEVPLAGNFNILGTANQVAVTGTANTETISLIGPYTPATYTAHGVLIGEGTSSIAAAAVGTTGQVLIGASAADPAFGALGVNSNLTGLVVGNTNTAFTATTYTAAGAFTPAFVLSTPGTSAWTYTSQVGRFTRLGAVVFFVAELTWSAFSVGSGSGTWQLNLPVAAGAFARAGLVQISGSGVDASAETANLPANFVGEITTGASTVILSVEEGGVGNAANALFNLTASQVKATGTMTVSGFYFAA